MILTEREILNLALKALREKIWEVETTFRIQARRYIRRGHTPD